jgi:predicted metalloprotease
MRWEEGRGSGNIEDRRGLGGGALIGGGGVGAVVLALIGYFVFGDPGALSGLQQQQAPPAQAGQRGAPADEEGRFVDQILGSTEEVWTQQLTAEGDRYVPPQTVLYDRATPTGCGLGQSAMGPFYCPEDRKVYLDLSFFQDLGIRFGAPGDFARAYVIAHEVGHHVQNLLGTSEQVDAARRRAGRVEANQLSVRLELQADCYAGIWAVRADSMRHWLEAGDVEEGLGAASAVGDDTLQYQAQGRVVPDAFTHGTSEQRVRWFRRGMQAKSLQGCDTFQGSYSTL